MNEMLINHENYLLIAEEKKAPMMKFSRNRILQVAAIRV